MIAKKEIEKLINTKKVLIFDFDGVIADSVDIKTEAFGELYSNYGEKTVHAVKLFHEQNGGVSRFEKIHYFNKVLLKNKKIEGTEEFFAQRFSEIVYKRVVECPEIVGSSAFIKLHSSLNKVLTINSATPTNELRNILKARNLESYFKYALGSPQNKTANIITILKDTGYHKNEAIFFGDAFSDIEAAETIDMDFIGVGQFFQNYKSKVLRASIFNFTDICN